MMASDAPSLTVRHALPLRDRKPAGATGTMKMLEIVTMGFVLLSAGIFLAHAYDMVLNASGERRA